MTLQRTLGICVLAGLTLALAVGVGAFTGVKQHIVFVSFIASCIALGCSLANGERK